MKTFATWSSANMNSVLQLGLTSQNDFELAEVKLRLESAATAANNFTITQRSKRGSQFDTVIFSQPMSGVADVVWQPDYAVKLNGKDRLSFVWTNDAASMKQWGLQVQYKA